MVIYGIASVDYYNIARATIVMLGKLTDTANILKAKFNKDELEEKLVTATSEENWQAPTNLLHELANAAYNYEKWNKIYDFINDKLKKKTTWRKIMKTLHLVDFLIKNGPPSAVQAFKQDIYTIRSYSDYESSEGGDGIREKSKQIVQLLSSEEQLQEEREKAKKIRDRMANVTGGTTYGSYNSSSGYGGQGKYQGFDNSTYAASGNTSAYSGGLGAYGDYNTNKSTLDKYKSQTTTTTSNNTSKPSITSTSAQEKKPFEKLAMKLVKPPSKAETAAKTSTAASSKESKPVPVQATKKSPVVDLFDLDGPSEAPETTQNSSVGNSAPTSTPGNNNNHSQGNGFNDFIGQTSQPPQSIGNSPYPQNYPQSGTPYQQSQGAVAPSGQSYGQQGFTQALPGQPYPGSTQGYGGNLTGYQQQYQPQQYQQQPYHQQPYQQQSYQPQLYQQQQYQQQYQQQPYHQQPYQQQPYHQPYQQQQQGAYGQPQPSSSTGVTLSSPGPNSALSTGGSSSNVKWLSNEEKGLIDFSDFSSELKAGPTAAKKPAQGLDTWAW